MSDDNKTGTEATTTTDNQELPDWARKQISDANAEAAKYRNQRNTIEADTKAAMKAEFDAQFKTLSDEKSAVAGERDTATSDLTKLKVALAAGVPGETAVEFAGLLQGKDETELAAHADKLKTMFGTPGKARAVDPSHGAFGNTAADPSDEFMRLVNKHLSK